MCIVRHMILVQLATDTCHIISIDIKNLIDLNLILGPHSNISKRGLQYPPSIFDKHSPRL